MARRRYFRYYKRTVPAKKKWASNIVIDEFGGQSQARRLVENSTQSASPTPTIVKTGNFKIQGDASIMDAGATAHVSARLFLVYVPEGVSVSSQAEIGSLVTKHPEYIMGWTVIDVDPTTTTGYTSGNKFSLTSRLKRNLNSGDGVYLLLLGSTTIPVTVTYTAQYYTCSN